MAKAQSARAASKAPEGFKDETEAPENHDQAAPSQAPKGFQNESSHEIDGWYEPKAGVAVQGQLVGHLKMKDEKGHERYVALLQLQYPVEATKDDEVVRLEPGQILGVGIRHQLTKMLDYIEGRGIAWFKAVKQVNLPGKRTMWVFEQAYKGSKKPLVELTKYSRGSSDDDDDSVPEEFR